MQMLRADVFNQRILEYTVNVPAMLCCRAAFCTDRVFLQDVRGVLLLFLCCCCFDLRDCDPVQVIRVYADIAVKKGNVIPGGDACVGENHRYKSIF